MEEERYRHISWDKLWASLLIINNYKETRADFSEVETSPLLMGKPFAPALVQETGLACK